MTCMPLSEYERNTEIPTGRKKIESTELINWIILNKLI